MTLDSILRYAATGSAAVAAVIISVPHLLDPGLALAQPAQSLRQRLNTPGTAFVTRATEYTFEFVGAQPGRWRVWPVNKQGKRGNPSEWRTFRYLR